MIQIADLRKFMDSLAKDIAGINGSALLSLEANMAKKIGAYSDSDTILFYLAPSADGSGDFDSYSETSMIVVFVMKKYNPLKAESAAVLEETQAVIEAVKQRIIRLGRMSCSFMQPDISSISTLPETELFANWAGWSIAFKAND